MSQTFPFNATFAVLALVGGIALITSIETLVPEGRTSPLAPRGASQSVVSVASTTPTSVITRMEVDRSTHSIRFYANDKPLAMLDAAGLHVEDAVAE